MELWEALWLALKIPLAAFSGKGYCVARYFSCYALERCGLLRWPLSLGPGLHSEQLAMDWFSHLLGLRLVIPLTLTFGGLNTGLCHTCSCTLGCLLIMVILGEIENTDTGEATGEESEAKETPNKVYRGPRVRSTNGLVDSVPILL
jgi:hypothetical protein